MTSGLRVVAHRLASMTRTLALPPADAGDTCIAPIIRATVAVLRRGGVVALPSDTLYGVTAMIDHSPRLYEVKRRSTLKPLGLFVSGPAEVSKWAKVTIPESVLHRLLPGPVTLIFDRLPSLPSDFNPETDKVGVRVPQCRIVNELCSALGTPLAQTSANPSGSTHNPLCVSDFCELHEDIDLILDGGTISSSPEGSTIVDLSRPGHFTVVREGCALPETKAKLESSGLTEFPPR